MKIVILNLLKSYKLHASPILEMMFGKACRFSPTCSEYAAQAVEKFGVTKGLALGLKRISRCHPFGGFGFDPVPRS